MTRFPRLALTAAVVLALVLAGAFLASDRPDGLERTAEDLGFADAARPQPALLPDYTVPGIAGGGSTVLAGLLGAGVCLAVAAGIAALARRTG
ncbi:MAG: PDGLE domain-containing protein [Planctomycetes bacterium]|nr:PDGLE domain-containing protein [Planctomycetota bacterium]